MNETTSRDGTTIAFDRSGEGPPIVVVGGAMSDRGAVGSLAALLASRFTVIAYDRRGRGESGDTPPYAVDREIDDLEALVGEAGGSVFAFGHSSGAVLVLEAAARGVAITKLALYEPPFIVDDSRAPVPDDYVAHLAELSASGRRGEAVEYFLTTAVNVPAEVVAQMRNSPMWPGMEALAHTLSYDGAIMGDSIAGDPLPADRWASVTAPTLVMDGGASPDWARNAVQALVDVLPHARRVTLEGQDHGADPALVAPVLEDFFGDEGSGPGQT